MSEDRRLEKLLHVLREIGARDSELKHSRLRYSQCDIYQVRDIVRWRPIPHLEFKLWNVSERLWTVKLPNGDQLYGRSPEEFLSPLRRWLREAQEKLRERFP